MKNSQAIKLFLAILISSSYVIIFANFGALAYEKIADQGKVYPEQTVIAGIDVANKSADEAEQLLAEAISDWRANTTISIYFKETVEQIDLANFDFKIDETLTKLQHGTLNDLIVTVKSKTFEQIEQFIDSEAGLDEQQLKEALMSIAAQLKTGDKQLQLEDLFEQEFNEETLQVTEINNNNKLAELTSFAKFFNKIEIEPFTRFSLLKLLEVEGSPQLSNETLSTVATALYEIVLKTNFTIVDRTISRELPNYADLGYEAKVNYERNLDFTFMNPNNLSYEIEFKIKDNSLQVSLIGQQFKYEYKPVFSNKATVEGKVIIQYSPTLGYGESQVEVAGLDGKIIEVSRQTINKTGHVIAEQFVAEDYYEPIHRVEIHSLVKESEEQREPPLQTDREVKEESENSNNVTENTEEDDIDENVPTETDGKLKGN